MSHTPGPWEKRGSAMVVMTPEGLHTFAVGRTNAEAEANAHLIAAAPELYEALQAGAKMRQLQKEYFKTRSKEILVASKQAEKEFDQLTTAAILKTEGRKE